MFYCTDNLDIFNFKNIQIKYRKYKTYGEKI